MKRPSEFTKGERIITIVSAIWLVIVFVIAFEETGGDFDEEFSTIFLLLGVVPILALTGWSWIRNAPKNKD